MSQPYHLRPPFAGKRIVLLHGAEKKIIGGEVLRSPPRRHGNFCLKQFWLNGSDNGDRHFVLKSENIRQVTLESVRPDVRARHRIDQLPRNANLPRRLAHSPLKDIAHAKPAPDFFNINGPTLKSEARIASDYE